MDASNCTRADFFQGMSTRHPTYRPYETPAYSNIAYGILAYALEAIVGDGRSFEQIQKDVLLGPLDLKRTFYHFDPNSTIENALIPFNASFAGLYDQGSYDDPAGSTYASTQDINSMARSILRSAILPQPLTNHWLKPLTWTSDLYQGVGMPFEIFRYEVPIGAGSSATRIVDLYTKAGDVGQYHTMMMMVPDYGVGITVMAAGESIASLMRITLAMMLRDAVVPAMEQVVAAQAVANFAGTYTDPSTNSSIAFDTSKDAPGLTITQWESRGVDMLTTGLGSVFDTTNLVIMLKPTLLAYKEANGRQRMGFRLIWDDKSLKGLMWSCFTWASQDSLTYGAVGFDEVVFEVGDDGKALNVDLRGFREVLTKQ